MLEFTCSTCGKHVQADESFAGKRVLCPACDQAMTAPTSTDSTTAIATPAHAAQAKIVQPMASAGAFSEGLPPLHDAPLTREEVPSLLGRWLPWIIVAGIAVVAIGLLIPAVQKTRESAARTQSINNLKQIVLAMQGFHDANKRLPFNGTKPAKLHDETSGSWAFMILPYIDQPPVDEPPAIRTNHGIAAYMCPGRGRPDLCTGVGGPGAWTDYFINPFLNDPNGVANAPDFKRTMIGITDGTSNTIFAGHGQIRPDDYGATDAMPGFTTTIFNGGSPAMCRGNRKVVNSRDSADTQPGNWGGPFRQGSLMGMGDGTVRMFPYSTTGGVISNGVCEVKEWFKTEHDFGDGPGVFPDPTIFAIWLTPSGGEALMIPDS